MLVAPSIGPAMNELHVSLLLSSQRASGVLPALAPPGAPFPTGKGRVFRRAMPSVRWQTERIATMMWAELSDECLADLHTAAPWNARAAPQIHLVLREPEKGVWKHRIPIQEYKHAARPVNLSFH